MISFTPNDYPTKHSLVHGIREWVKTKIDRPFASLPNLERLTFEELVYLAQAMGYQPNEKLSQQIIWSDSQVEATRKGWAEESEKAQAQRAARREAFVQAKIAMIDSVLDVLAEDLVNATEEDIRRQAIARNIDPELLAEKVRDAIKRTTSKNEE